MKCPKCKTEVDVVVYDADKNITGVCTTCLSKVRVLEERQLDSAKLRLEEVLEKHGDVEFTCCNQVCNNKATVREAHAHGWRLHLRMKLILCPACSPIIEHIR